MVLFLFVLKSYELSGDPRSHEAYIPTPLSISRSNISLIVQAELRNMKAPKRHFRIPTQYCSRGRFTRYAAIVSPHAIELISMCDSLGEQSGIPNGQNMSFVPVGFSNRKNNGRETKFVWPTFSSLISSRYGLIPGGNNPRECLGTDSVDVFSSKGVVSVL